MALTIAVLDRLVVGTRHSVIANVTFDASYPPGGEAVLGSDFGLDGITEVICTEGNGYVVQYDDGNKKLKVYYGDLDAVADGPFIEVPDTTDIATVAVRLWVIGNSNGV